MNKKRLFSSNKKLLFRLLIATSLISTSHTTFGQVFSADQNPPTLQWRQINTKNFQIIYPKEIENDAQRMANTLDKIIQRVSSSLNKTPRKISIILQNQGTTSNGFVQLAPRRSEFYTTPSQSFDYQNWLNSLAVHELRHVVQFDKLTGTYNRPVLESLALSIFGIILPPWFYEGDAVNIETALTKAGRGRLPEWSIYLRSNLLSGNDFSYSKNYFGSVKNFTPGYYQLGNYLNAYMRRNYGKGIMDSLFSRMSSNPLRPYNLSNSIKKYTGLSTRKLHDATMADLKNQWENQLQKNNIQEYPSLNKRKDNTPSNYLYPTAINNSQILYLKQSKGETPAFYKMNSQGKSKKLFRIGYQETTWFSYAANKIVWDESRGDLRYRQRSFNVIGIYDLQTQKAKQLTHHSRLFAPALSADGQTIAAIEVSYSNQISLVELDARNGKEIKRYVSPQNYMLQMPSFNSDASKIIMVAVATTGKTLLELDRKSGTFTPLLPLQFQEILKPVYVNDQIVFKAHYNGIDNLYKLEKTTGEIKQLTSARFGAFNPSYDASNNRILFNNFTSGYDIAELKWDSNAGKSIAGITNTSIDYSKPLYEQEGSDDVFDSIPTARFESKHYSDLQLRNLFYFHSVYPLAGDGLTGLELRSDNKLNTIGLYADYLYNSTLGRHEYAGGIEFKRYLPVFTVYYSNEGYYTTRGGISVPTTARQSNINGQISFPLRLNRFNQNYSFNLLARITHRKLYEIDYPFANLPVKKTTALYQFSAIRQTQKSSRDLLPKFGQSLTIAYRHHPFKQLLVGDIWTLRASMLFPGLFKNHSLQTSFNWQTSTGDFRDDIYIPRVRGYAYSYSLGSPYNTLTTSYVFPLFYPDWQLGPFAYIKRFKAGVFSDFQNLGHGNSSAPRSYGAEIRADMNLFRFYLPNFDIGERVIFLNEKNNQNPIFEFMLSYSL